MADCGGPQDAERSPAPAPPNSRPMRRPLQPPDIDHFMSPGSRRGPAALRVDPRRGRPGQDQMLFCKLATVLLEGIRRLSYIDLLNSPCSSSPIKMRFPVLRPMARITTSRSAAYPAAGVPGIPQLDYRRALLMVSTEAVAGPDNVRQTRNEVSAEARVGHIDRSRLSER